MHRIVLMMVGFILLAFALATWLMPEWREHALPRDRQHGEALIGGPFIGVTHLGEPVTDQALLGHYSLVYFGFTYCPDICPTTLLVVANAMDSLQPALSDNILPVFISVDPERDTVDVMRQYVRNFHPRLLGITGTPEQVKVMADAYKVYYNRVDTPDSAAEYLIDHSGFLYLMNPQGKYITHFPHHVSEQVLADALRQHIKF